MREADPAPTGEKMPAATSDERRRSFDQMAQLYARARGAPPPALFDAVAVFVPPPADALEIGCGPGNASLPLLERGFRIHAVELGVPLARSRARAAPSGESAQARRRAGAHLGLAPPHRRGQPCGRGDPGG